MRLFVAIEIPTDVRGALAAFLNELRGIAPLAKWVRAENLHLTLKFLGETDSSRLGAISKALCSVRSPHPVDAAVSGLGFFPEDRRSRVFWAGLEASPNLKTLAADIDHALHKVGFPLEERPFSPHLTLARFNPPGTPPKLASLVKENAARGFGSLSESQFHLIESKLKPTGAEYTTLQSFPFVAET